MGSGKTTAGKKLASLLGWSYIDLDKKIEEYEGKSIPEIFSENGEEYFRITESRLLKKLDVGNNTVISTGGGTPCYCNNMDIQKLRLGPVKFFIRNTLKKVVIAAGLKDKATLQQPNLVVILSKP